MTLVESLVAALLITLFLAAVFSMNGTNLQFAKSGKESVAATMVLDQRVEQLRGGKWEQITDPAFVATLLSTASGASTGLSGVTEQITLSAYPMPSPATTVTRVIRSSAGAVNTRSANLALAVAAGVRVDLQVAWSGTPGGRGRVRELSTIIARGGLVAK